jgi:hypothetical protein
MSDELNEPQPRDAKPTKSKVRRTVYTISGRDVHFTVPPSDLPTEVKVFRSKNKGGKTTVIVKGAKTEIKRA